MEYQVYLVEDEANLNQLLTTYLVKEGWQVKSFLDGESARRAIPDRPHLWILDIMLPDIDGYQLIREIKADAAGVPVIFISARDSDIDRIVGLEMGSDDYLPKPFLPRELVIRARKLLARVYGSEQNNGRGHTYHLFPYLVDEEGRRVLEGDREVELTSKEFDLLLYLVKNQGQPLERDQVLEHVWGSGYFGSDRVVDDLVRRLRKKLPQLKLETIYGYGYRLVKR